MDLATIIGVVLIALALLGSILLSAPLTTFYDLPSILCVGIGTMGTTFIKWPLDSLKSLGTVTLKAVFFKNCDVKATIEEIGTLAETARRESVFALEKVPIEDAFMKKAMTLAADNRPPEVIQSILQLEIDNMVERHKTGGDMLDGIAADGPSFGLLGTIIGLVIMLKNMSDPSAIGPAMAVALLTTFYGSIIANCIAGPLKQKIGLRSGEEVNKMNIIVAGTLGIVAGENPRLIREKLAAFLAPNDRPKSDEEQASPAAKA
ncbi:MAG: flagellar motor protein MotP [Bdellovibrionales bacterium GWA2_49_15]|nr:MAG: flagellar motor protein MotP [Bdellovibrionales bacterium GWA2_49_15]HAZ12024.1 motility protein A [Bdellovibrionales bacterium]